MKKHCCKAYRHGDMALIPVKEMPKGLKPSQSKVLMTGSGGHDHSFDKGKFYPVSRDNGLIVGYYETKTCAKLFHPEHGEKCSKTLREVKMPKGIYEVRKQMEDTNEGMKPVVD